MRRFIAGLSFVVLGCCLTGRPAVSQQQTSAVTNDAAPHRALLDQYCVTCHNERVKTAGLMLDRMDLQRVPENAETWEKVIRKLRGGMMPPTGRARPTGDDTFKFIAWLENTIDLSAARKPNPGRASIHRLNRTEYGNAIRDLL
jgi:cytochrome c5